MIGVLSQLTHQSPMELPRHPKPELSVPAAGQCNDCVGGKQPAWRAAECCGCDLVVAADARWFVQHRDNAGWPMC